MDFEEREKQRRRQFLKVLVAEAGMMVSIIAIVIVATLAAMGFFVSSQGTIEQSGLIQIHSLPTGATVEIDGNVVFSRTNLSRTLAPGEHYLKLSRDGYDTWEKPIQMYSGILMRLYYPRLFLKNRTAELALNLGAELEFYSPSVDRDYILYAEQDSPKWNLINVHDTPEVTALDLSEVLPGVKEKKFLGKIEKLTWNENGDRVLVQVSYEGKNEWILVNLRNLTASLNLTKTFGLEFTKVEMIDDSASQLFALENGQLRKISTANQAISRVLLSDVEDFANSKTNVIYVAKKTSGEQTKKIIGTYRDDERGGVSLAETDPDKTVKVSITRYYDEDYMAYIINNKLSIYYGSLPAYRERAEEIDMAGTKVLFENYDLEMTPSSLSLSPEGEYFVAKEGNRLAVVDFEMSEVTKYELPTTNFAWLDDNMMMAVADQVLEVWDFDNQNKRELVKYTTQKDAKFSEITTKSSAELMNYPAIIADNNKWMYYLVKSNSGVTLMRERIRD